MQNVAIIEKKNTIKTFLKYKTYQKNEIMKRNVRKRKNYFREFLI